MKKLIIGMLVVVGLTGSAQAQSGNPVKTKKVSKSFAVNSSDRVTVNNQYGALEIKTWSRNEVKLEVDIDVYGDNPALAQELLDKVFIKAGSKDGEVILDTKLSRGKSGKTKIKASYLIYMPQSNSLNLTHEYGDVILDDLSGPLEAKIQYGNFKAGQLKNARNHISIRYGSANIGLVNKAEIVQQYGSGLTIGTIGTLKLEAAYAAVKISAITGKATIAQKYGPGLTITTVQDLDLSAAYAGVKIGTIKGAAQINQKYSNVTIGTAGPLTVNTQYANVKIAILRGNGEFTMQYNSLNIGNIGNECRDLDINCAYLKTELNFNSGYDADLEVNTRNSDFRYGSGISVQKTGTGTSRAYSGKIGKGGSSKVSVNSSYGSLVMN